MQQEKEILDLIEKLLKSTPQSKDLKQLAQERMHLEFLLLNLLYEKGFQGSKTVAGIKRIVLAIQNQRAFVQLSRNSAGLLH